MNTSAEFLNLLIGQWELTGQMGTTKLQQAVTVQWVLERSFVELHFASTLPASVSQPPYQAIYFIGHDEQNDTYVMHLLDTFGAGFSRVIGLGKRDGNTIPFIFQYKEGPFMNRLIWESSTQSWTFELTYEQDGQVHTFATKHMTRRK
ncbi:MAG TPA: hypothetical protein VK851_04310 [Anaerolineales bacterium]|nr:hypothetical protein [Anaerolineales bacterium]